MLIHQLSAFFGLFHLLELLLFEDSLLKTILIEWICDYGKESIPFHLI